MAPSTAATLLTLHRMELVSYEDKHPFRFLLNFTLAIGFERPSTPSSDHSSPINEPPEFVSRPRDLSDDDEEQYDQQRSGNLPKKKGGYDSRVEQILYENPDLQIIITDAGKSNESGGSYIVYTIRTGVCLSSISTEGHMLRVRRISKYDADTRSSVR